MKGIRLSKSLHDSKHIVSSVLEVPVSHNRYRGDCIVRLAVFDNPSLGNQHSEDAILTSFKTILPSIPTTPLFSGPF